MADKDYDAGRRKIDPALRQAKHVRSSARWKKLRTMKLNHTPLCENPDWQHTDVPVVAHEVDHKQSLQERPDLAYVWENLQSLCRTCHARKSARERARGG